MKPLAIDRPLTDDERMLLIVLAVRCVAAQAGVGELKAAAAVRDVVDRDELTIAGDATTVTVYAFGNSLVQADRDWLAFHANNPDENPMDDRRIR